MKINSMIKTAFLFFFFSSMLFTSISCRLTMARDEHLEMVVKGASFTIAWDDDSLKISHNINKAVKYKIYYRKHGSSFWRFLGETDAVLNPQYVIDQSMLDCGVYDIGVSAVNEEGRESVIHSSLDDTADPFCGWYVNWIGSK